MNRRDLLKQAGAALVAASSVTVPVIAYNKASAETQLQDLVVSFVGPFCYWQENDHMRIMAPQVVKNFCVPHLPWVGTTANEKRLQWCQTQTYHYALEGLASRTMNYSGETMCSFDQDTCGPKQPPGCLTCPSKEGGPTSSKPRPNSKTSSSQEEYDCCPALFDIKMPFPDLFIGINPTCLTFTPPRPDGPRYASAVNFFYKNDPQNPIDFQQIRLSLLEPKDKDFEFKPDFKNDHGLPTATLRINLSALDHRDDPDHKHAKEVFFQTLKMFPWMDVQSIDFCDRPAQVSDTCALLRVGPGDDCLAPVFLLRPTEASKRKSKK